MKGGRTMSYDREPDIDVDDLRKVDDRDDLLADLEAMSSDDYGNAFMTDDTLVGKKKSKKKRNVNPPSKGNSRRSTP